MLEDLQEDPRPAGSGADERDGDGDQDREPSREGAPRGTARPEDWPWSSARAHLASRDDGIVSDASPADSIDDFGAFFALPEEEAAIGEVLRSAFTGGPAGAAEWLADLEETTQRRLARGPARTHA